MTRIQMIAKSGILIIEPEPDSVPELTGEIHDHGYDDHRQHTEVIRQYAKEFVPSSS